MAPGRPGGLGHRGKLAKRHLQDGALLLCELTKVFLEGTTCDLGAYGHGKEHRNNKLQIVVGLLCNREGIQVSVQVFEGNVSECGRLGEQVTKVQERFGLQRVVFVADRGILRSARIKEDLLPCELDWVTTLRRPAINDLIKKGAFQPSLFEEVDLAEIIDPAYPGERLMVCRNPILAEERNRRRGELLDRTEGELKVIKGSVDRVKKPLRGGGGRDRQEGGYVAEPLPDWALL